MNITIKGYTSILMKWNEPTVALGPISGFLIKVRDEEAGRSSIIELTGSERSFTFESDKEHVE